MWLKRLLIIAPAVFVVALLQSYFWVPRYEAHTTSNPTRASKYIEASIGDAKLLNPVVNADTASSRIADLVFDGLLKLGPDLALAPRLATHWRVREHAFLVVDSGSALPDGTAVSGASLLEHLQQTLIAGGLPGVTRVALEPPHKKTMSLTRTDPEGEPLSVPARVRVPARIRFELDAVDQDLLTKLTGVIGTGYGSSFAAAAFVDLPADATAAAAHELDELLPLLEHNPIIDFTLREDVVFHDGHRFDAGDVEFTYGAIMNARNLSPRTSSFEPIKQLQVLGPHAVRIIYKRLFSPAIEAWTIGILPEHLLNDARLQAEAEARGLSESARAAFGLRDTEFNRQPVGTGPFRFAEWRGDEYVHLQRFEQHWEQAPVFNDYYFRVIPDLLTQEMEFRTGAIDRYGPLPHQVERLRTDSAYQSYSYPDYSFTYIGYNNRRELFQDPRVRRALGMAVNVDEIIRYVLYGEAEPMSGPYPQNTPWYDHTVAPLDYDPQAASRLLAETGWQRNADGWLEKDGRLFEFNLVTNNGNPVRKAVMTIAQAHWRKLGIKCNTQVFEWAVFLEDFINPANFDAVILGWRMSVDPDLYQIWHSSQSGYAQLNFIGYSNPAADDLIVRIRREYDADKQLALAHKLHREIALDQPYTFLFSRLSTQIYDRKIGMLDRDGQVGPLEVPPSGDPFYYFTRWVKTSVDIDADG